MMNITPEAAEEFRELMQDPASREAFVEVKRQRGGDAATMRYEHIFHAILATPWAIHPPYMTFLADLLTDRMAGVRLSAEDIASRLDAARRPARAEAPAGVAVIPIHGPIAPRASMMTDVSGATSIPDLRANLREAMAAPEVSSIVFDIDSPGGNVQGVPELAGEIRSMRGRKPMTASVSGLMASAAYWLGSQADSIVASKSALLGSIGVISAHQDMTGAAEQKGIKVSLISAGKFKTLGHPMEPMSEEGHGRVQAMVDEFYSMFVSDVAKARGVGVDAVRGGFGEGDIVGAREAVSLGMADRVGSLETVVSDHLRGNFALAAGVADGAPGEVMTADEYLKLRAAEDSEPDPDEAPASQETPDEDVVGFEARERLRRLRLMKHLT